MRLMYVSFSTLILLVVSFDL